jgi:hypothetical protein
MAINPTNRNIDRIENDTTATTTKTSNLPCVKENEFKLTDARIVVNKRINPFAFLLVISWTETSEKRSHPQSPPSVVTRFPDLKKKQNIYIIYIPYK